MSRGLATRRLCRLPLIAAVLVATEGQVLAQRAGTPPPPPSLQAPATTLSNNPVPPMPIPNVPGPTIVTPGPAVVPPSAPLVLPSSQPPPNTPSSPAAAQTAPAAPAGPTMRPGEGAVQAAARFGAGAPLITGGLHWRVYADRPDQTGVFRLVKEDRSPQPTFVLPSGSYIVHVAFGHASAAKPVQVRGDLSREMFEIPAGGLRVEGRVGDVKIPPSQISFDIYKGSQFEQQPDRRPIASSVLTGDVVLVPEGTYYIVSKYGDGNSLVRSDIRVQNSRLTDVIVTHRAAAIMLKLVPRRGGEALANTDWAVVSPAGDTITESKGAFPRVILAEGEYKVIARNENRTFQQDIKVITGVDGEVEVLAR